MLSLRSRGSGCDCVAWPLQVSTVERGLSFSYSKSLAEDISSGSLTCSLCTSASTYCDGHNGACHYTIRCNHCRHRLYEATRWALRGRPSFVCHVFWSISLSISFISGLYTEPFRLLRKYKVENGDFNLCRIVDIDCKGVGWRASCLAMDEDCVL